jgi:hypothetical protein
MRGLTVMSTRETTLNVIRNLDDENFRKVTDYVRTITHHPGNAKGLSKAEMDSNFDWLESNYGTDMERLAQ